MLSGDQPLDGTAATDGEHSKLLAKQPQQAIPQRHRVRPFRWGHRLPIAINRGRRLHPEFDRIAAQFASGRISSRRFVSTPHVSHALVSNPIFSHALVSSRRDRSRRDRSRRDRSLRWWRGESDQEGGQGETPSGVEDEAARRGAFHRDQAAAMVADLAGGPSQALEPFRVFVERSG